MTVWVTRLATFCHYCVDLKRLWGISVTPNWAERPVIRYWDRLFSLYLQVRYWYYSKPKYSHRNFHIKHIRLLIVRKESNTGNNSIYVNLSFQRAFCDSLVISKQNCFVTMNKNIVCSSGYILWMSASTKIKQWFKQKNMVLSHNKDLNSKLSTVWYTMYYSQNYAQTVQQLILYFVSKTQMLVSTKWTGKWSTHKTLLVSWSDNANFFWLLSIGRSENEQETQEWSASERG